MTAPTDDGSVPSIDVEGFAGDPDRLAREVGEACTSVGAFTITGHGVDPAVVARLDREAQRFFALPLVDRLAVATADSTMPYGYIPVDDEALERSIGGETAPDLKETFNIGPFDPPPVPPERLDDPDERAIHSPTPWPTALPALRTAAEAYYRVMEQLAGALMATFARALGLPADWFAPLIDRHGSALRLAHYPALTDPAAVAGRDRAGAHTDYGTLTILWTDGRPGLQFQRPDGEWVDVVAEPGSFVVNLGDLMQRWTNDRWRSTMHRVVAVADGAPRRSIPFFHNANWDARIECLVADGEPPRYPPTTAGHHLMEKYRATRG